MVSISNSTGSTAYTRSAQLGTPRPDPSQTRTKPAETKDSSSSSSSLSSVSDVRKPTRSDLPDDAKAASNDAGRFRDNTQLKETNDQQTLNTEAQRGSLLDLAV